MLTSRLVQHLEKLRYLVAIADEGSFARAAAKFRLSQPALSRSIHTLEDTLGVRLFERTSTGETLTPPGEQVCELGRKILADAEKLEHSLHLAEGAGPGHLVLGTKEP